MTPDTAGYYQVAYVAAAVIYLLYAASIWQRARRASKRMGGTGGRIVP